MNLLHFPVLDSTNTYLKEHWARLPHETVVIADRQTGGKGRLGRQWETPGGNLSFSVLFREQRGEVSLFPLCAAIAAAEVLEETCGAPIGIKWPNDLILQNKKLCGILCESVAAGNTFQVMCGIGVNITLDQAYFDRVGLPHATSLLLALGRQPDPVELARGIAARLFSVVEEWQSAGFPALRTRYEARLLNTGREVQVVYGAHTVRAFARGIDEHGYLLCENENGSFAVNSGEASVRGLYGYVE